MIRAVAVIILLLSTLTAMAREPDAEARARAHYEVGLGMYHLGNYGDAVREFSAGYELSPRPEFLINLGQAYRKLGDLEKAHEMFTRYLEQAAPNDLNRKQVKELLDEVDRARAEAMTKPPATPTVTAPATATPPPVASSPAPVPVAAPASSAAVTDVVSASPPRRSALRRFWWTIPVGAVVVGAAIGLGIYFGTASPQLSCTSASIGCIDLRN